MENASVIDWVRVRIKVRVKGLVMICPSESSRERVKVNHVIVECRVINHNPYSCHFTKFKELPVSTNFMFAL